MSSRTKSTISDAKKMMKTSPNFPINSTKAGFVPMALALLMFAGCATTQPVLLQTEKTTLSTQQIDRVIELCRNSADRDVGRNALNAPTVSKKLGKVGASEFADAYVENVVKKSAGAARRAAGAAAGGIAGVATKLAFDWNEPDRVYQKHVEHCIEKRGHKVLGWR
jgi:hypothetical protein